MWTSVVRLLPSSVTRRDRYKVPLNYGYRLNPRMPTPTTENYQPYLQQYSIPENTSSFYDTQYPWHANQVYHDPDVLASTHVAHIRIPQNLGLRNPSDPHADAEVLATPYSPAAVNEKHGDYMMSTSYSVLDPRPEWTWWSTSPDRQPLFPLVDQETGTLHHFLAQASAHPSHACSSHATQFHSPCLEPSIPHRSPSHQAFSQTLLHFNPHSTPTGSLETYSRSHLPFYRVSHQNSPGSSHSKCAARAIEYDGLRVDEQELLKALIEPDGKLTVHQCRWEEDHSACLLWIRGDKSSINAHIQKWHGGKPGGEKLQVHCRWSACGKTMLKESIARLIVDIHLGEIWECQGCGKEITRSDAYRRHAERSDFNGCKTSGALITYSGDVRVIDARAALECGGGPTGYAAA
ncbi:hypothetical protein OG21DRAFT_1494401 [Imleria badia]|nr:hypothetical protein OG21DRAFT_1494401 [Imleria badia]